MTREKLYEVLGDIKSDYITEAEQDSPRRQRPWGKWGSLAACLCLVAAAMWYGMFSGVFTSPLPHGGPGGVSSSSESLSGLTNLQVNAAAHVKLVDLDVQISLCQNLTESEWDAVRKSFESSTGLQYNDFLQKLPADYQLNTFYSVDVPADPGRTDYLPHDYVFEYVTAAGGTVNIALCAEEEPLRDCFFTCKNPKPSQVNGTEVWIYSVQDSFMIQFSHDNVNYDIETENVTLDELAVLLTSIMDA